MMNEDVCSSPGGDDGRRPIVVADEPPQFVHSFSYSYLRCGESQSGQERPVNFYVQSSVRSVSIEVTVDSLRIRVLRHVWSSVAYKLNALTWIVERGCIVEL